MVVCFLFRTAVRDGCGVGAESNLDVSGLTDYSGYMVYTLMYLGEIRDALDSFEIESQALLTAIQEFQQ